MTEQRKETQKAIIKRLQELTLSCKIKIKWGHGGQTYRTRFQGLIFEIVDSGQGWLKIKYESGADSIVIMDQHEEVESLLVTIKHSLFAFEIEEIKRVSGYELDQELNRIFKILNSGA